MKQKILPFYGTKEQEQTLRNKLAELKQQEASLMVALQYAQDLYGYLPYEVQRIIADELGVTLAEVYGVVTFYSQFTMYPKGKYQIGICLGTACYVKGSGEIYDKLRNILGIESGECTPDRMFSLDATRCIGCCGLAPVMTVNGEVYGNLTSDDVDGILSKYIAMEGDKR